MKMADTAEAMVDEERRVGDGRGSRVERVLVSGRLLVMGCRGVGERTDENRGKDVTDVEQGASVLILPIILL